MDGRKLKMSRREVLDETKRLIIEEDMMANMEDSDDDRMDFVDA